MRKSNTTRMTSKGQVTIPKHLRDKLGVKPGDELGFREDGPALIIENFSSTMPRRRNGEDKGDYAIRALAEFGRKHWDPEDKRTTDEIMEDLRGYSQDANDPGFQHRS